MEDNINKNNISPKYYSMSDFLNEFKKVIFNDNLEPNFINSFQAKRQNNTIESDFSKNHKKPEKFTKSEIRDNLSENLKILDDPPINNVNEVMISEIKNLSKENDELKFCLNILNNKYEKEFNELKVQNINKTKEIKNTKEIIKQNILLIEMLGEKINSYEKIFKKIELKNNYKTNFDENFKDKLLNAMNENNELKKEIIDKDEIIKNFREEIDTKKEVFEEIDKMKNDMEEYLKTMDKLYEEIEKKDEEIDKLKKDMDLMNTKHKQEIENIAKNKDINFEQFKFSSNEELMNEISKSKDKQIKLTKELIEIQKNYTDSKNSNIELQNLAKEGSDMIKKSINSREKIKQEYDKTIKDLVSKYEKQIQTMKLEIVEQNEKYEKQLEDLKNVKNKDNIYINNINNENEDNIDEEDKNRYLEKLKNDNIILIEQNLELKNMNDMLLSKMNELPNLHDKFNELFEKVKLLKEENDFLKKSIKNNKILKILNQEDEIKEEDDENENIDNDKNIKNNINKENKNNDNVEGKLNLEELQILESLLKDVENNGGENNPKKEIDMNKLILLDNILKKLENKNEEDDKEYENDKEKEENEEEKKYDEDLNLKKQLLLEAMLKNLGESGPYENNENFKSEKNNNNNDLLTNINNKEELKDKQNDFLINEPTEIYNKMFLKSSPKIIKKLQNTNNNEEKKNTILKRTDFEGDNENEEIENEEIENGEEDDEENSINQINESFELYKPTKEGILSFNLSKKSFSNISPNNFDEFSKIFDQETSVQYNTLEGLFIIPSNKSNQLFYYSSKKNTMNELFLLKENHSGGCLFLDNTSKFIFALGGSESKAVEQFSFETGQLEQLPNLSTHRSKITCNQIENKIYCFFGISKEKPNKSLVEFLDLENIDEGWKEIDFINNADFNIISGMSCINLNDNELLFIGGLLNDEIANEKLFSFNIEDKELKKIDNDLPESDIKEYLFTQNTMFNLFVNGDIISFANIDDNNHVHILNDKLMYELYLAPKT